VREHRAWSIFFEPMGLEAPPPWFHRWEGDGILARSPEPRMAEAVLAKHLPAVDLWGSLPPWHSPMVAGDNDQIAQLAFEHLWERGLRHFAFCGHACGYSSFAELRAEAFRRRAAATGRPCDLLFLPSRQWCSGDLEFEQRRIEEWLESLPKPLGVLACLDELAFQIINVCQRCGLRVPEEVAVVGVGNDPVLCELSTPNLTSIDLDAPRIGYEAASWLDALMSKADPPSRPVRIPPRGLVNRRSTDVRARHEPGVVAALQFIRDHACDGVRVGDVVRHASISWSTLEREFKRLIGRNPKDEILRVRLTLAERLLTQSNLPLSEVARRCGFSGEKYFSDAFRRATGSRPRAYRHGSGPRSFARK
jgi:LacI family transcriptional regulator